MTKPSLGFDGSRLREAREARGVSATSLADLTGLTRQAISAYEVDRVAPSAEVFDRIATQLNLPLAFFTRPPRVHQLGTVFNRSMAATTKAARTKTEHRFEWMHDIVRYLSDFVDFPEPNFPDFGLPEDVNQISSGEIEEAAYRLRQSWNLGDDPVANMVSLLEHQGAILARDAFGAESLESLSEFSAEFERPFVLVGTDKGTAARWRFDVAHELGHLILHSHVSNEALRDPKSHKLIEGQAHLFAGAFLLPCAQFGEELLGTDIDHFLALKPRWKVSVAAMIKRARQCDFIDADREKLLWIRLNRRGWRTSEPFDGAMQVEEPRLLKSAVELLLENAGLTSDEILEQLALRSSDVEPLCGLSSGFFSTSSLVKLRISASDDVESNPKDTPAEIIQLRPTRRLR